MVSGNGIMSLHLGARHMSRTTFHPLGSGVTRKSNGGSTVEVSRSRQRQSRGLNGGILRTQRLKSWHLRSAVEAKAVAAMVAKIWLPSDEDLPYNVQMKCYNARTLYSQIEMNATQLNNYLNELKSFVVQRTVAKGKRNKCQYREFWVAKVA